MPTGWHLKNAPSSFMNIFVYKKPFCLEEGQPGVNAVFSQSIKTAEMLEVLYVVYSDLYCCYSKIYNLVSASRLGDVEVTEVFFNNTIFSSKAFSETASVFQFPLKLKTSLSF